jgi:flavin-dependent dehydrogenase
MEVVVFDNKNFEKPGPAGCNMCAGIIPDSLVRNLRALGIDLPHHVIQRRIEGYRLETKGGWVDLPTPQGTSLYATFRGPGPLGMYPAAQEGFDWFLLSEAQRSGAAHMNKLVTDLIMPAEKGGRYRVLCRDGFSMEADLIVGAFGVNSNLGGVFERLDFGYRLPRTMRARQAEIPLDPDFIQREIRNRVLIFAMGWPGIRFAAITPKRQHVTVTLIGDDLGPERMHEVLDSPAVRKHLPSDWTMPSRCCSCVPRLPVSAAHNPIYDRLVVIGDAHISRYLKNGIESSFHTAKWAARALVTGTADCRQLRREYLRPCRRTYLADNAHGRVLLKLHDFISLSPTISQAHIEVAREEQRRPGRKRQLTEILWGTFTGNIPYRGILRKALSPRLQARLMQTLLKTAWRQSRSRRERAISLAGAPAVLRSDSQRIIIIGGGPAGAACAITLARERTRTNLAPSVVLIESKRFGEQQNQCAGVLSPPGPELIAQVLGEAPPPRLFQRRIKGYVLHGGGCSIYLDGEDLGDSAYALRRVELDNLLLEQAEGLGVQVVHTRATDLEVNPEGVTVYTESGSFHGDAVVGAFALDEGMARSFARRTRYQPPASLEALVCKIHPAGEEFISRLLDDCIHVFLPKQSRVDFGALVPKGNHIVVIIAGARLGIRDMQEFMALPQVAKTLPEKGEFQGYFKGAFPLGPARGIFGNRYVVIGDAAGMVRPFKGKGINSALEGGQRCAQTILGDGVFKEAFAGFVRSQRHLTRDVWYGRFVRRLVMLTSKHDLLDPFIEHARSDRALCQALFDCVSGRTTYRDVVLRRENARWLPAMVWRCLAYKTHLCRRVM